MRTTTIATLRPRAAALLLLLVVLVAAGCSGNGSGRPSTGRSGQPVAGEQSISSGSETRSYVLVRPAGVSSPAPVVIMLHGAASAGLGHGLQGVLGLDEVAARSGIVTVYPDGETSTHSWRVGCCYGEAADPADVRFISDLIDHLVASGVADPAHVVVGGFSAGGFLANELGCQIADKVSAVVTLAGTQTRPPSFVDQVVSPPVAPCVPSRPVSHIDIHGTDDPAVPIDGSSQCSASPCGPGQRGYVAPAASVTQWWQTIDACGAPATSTRTTGSTTVDTSLAQCADGTVVGLARVDPAGHDVAALRSGFDVDQTIVDLALGHPLSSFGGS